MCVCVCVCVYKYIKQIRNKKEYYIQYHSSKEGQTISFSLRKWEFAITPLQQHTLTPRQRRHKYSCHFGQTNETHQHCTAPAVNVP